MHFASPRRKASEPRNAGLTRAPRGWRRASTRDSEAVPGVGPVPLLVVEVVAVAHGRVRDADDVEERIEHDPPPLVLRHVEGLHDLPEVDSDLDADLPLSNDRIAVRIALRPVGDRQQQEARRAGVEPRPLPEAGDLEVAGVDLGGIVLAEAADRGGGRGHDAEAEADQVVQPEVQDGEAGRRAERVGGEVLPGEPVLVGAVADLGRGAREKRRAGGEQGRFVVRSAKRLVELVHDPRHAVVRDEVRRLVRAPRVGVLAEPALVRDVEREVRLLLEGVERGPGDGEGGAGPDPDPLGLLRRRGHLHRGLLEHERPGSDDRAERFLEPRPRHELRVDPDAERAHRGRRGEDRGEEDPASTSHASGAAPPPARWTVRDGNATEVPASSTMASVESRSSSCTARNSG